MIDLTNVGPPQALSNSFTTLSDNKSTPWSLAVFTGDHDLNIFKNFSSDTSVGIVRNGKKAKKKGISKQDWFEGQ